MKNKFKLTVLIITFIIFLSACGKDTDKFLQGTWESKETPDYSITFDDGDFTMSKGDESKSYDYKIRDVMEDIIYIEVSGYPHGVVTVDRYQKDGDKLLYLDSSAELNGEHLPGFDVDGQYEELEKVSGGSGVPNWVYIIGFIILIGLYTGWKKSD